MARMIFHYPPARFSVGVKIAKDGTVHIVSAACHKRDVFNKRIAFAVLIGRLAQACSTYKLSRQLSTKVDLASIKSLNRELYGPIRDVIRSVTDPGLSRSKRRIAASNLRNLSKLASTIDSAILSMRKKAPKPATPPLVATRPITPILPPFNTARESVQADGAGSAASPVGEAAQSALATLMGDGPDDDETNGLERLAQHLGQYGSC